MVELSIVDQRYDAVREMLRGELSVTEVAELFGVSRQVLYKWKRRYEEAGVAGLVDRSHKPKSCPHQMPPEVEARLCELRRWHPEWGPTRLVYELERDGASPVPSRSSVYRALVRNGLIIPKAKKRRVYRRWERVRPMELWQADVMGRIELADGTGLRMVSIIDDYSRFCVGAVLCRRATAKAVCDAFAGAMRRYGVPEEVLTDNGKVFTGRFGRGKPEMLFERILRENGITHRLTGVRAPTTTGKVERFHKTLRDDLFSIHTFSSLEEAQSALDAAVAKYNTRRPHQSLDMMTPAERFTQRQLQMPDITEVDDGVIEIQRRVGEAGRIRVNTTRYLVGRWAAGEIVDVRLDRNLVHIFHAGRLIKTHPKRHDDKEVRYRGTHRERTNKGDA